MRSTGLHPVRQCASARDAFREERGADGEATRALEIARLPIVEWKGRTLRTVRCRGLSGKGPHDVNVPEMLLWALISLDAYRCPYHVNSDYEYSRWTDVTP